MLHVFNIHSSKSPASEKPNIVEYQPYCPYGSPTQIMATTISYIKEIILIF